MIQWGKLHKGISWCLILAFVVSIVGCTTSKTDFNKKYREEWKKIITSQAWNDALDSNNALASLDDETYIVVSDVQILNMDYKTIMNTDATFNEKYNSLVSRSYFKIIIEAQKADDHLKEEYNRLNLEKKEATNKNNPDFKKKLTLVNKRYRAHKEMLEGLKGWNIFSENRTGDLEFFKKENVNTVYKKYKGGETDETIIGFLVYQLADLYHFEN